MKQMHTIVGIVVLLLTMTGCSGLNPEEDDPRPDLAVSGYLVSPEVMGLGEVGTIAFSVANVGDADSPPTTFFFEVVDENLALWDTASITIPSLAPGLSVDATIQWIAEPGEEGKKFIVFGSVNSDGSLFDEHSFNNNVDSSVFFVVTSV